MSTDHKGLEWFANNKPLNHRQTRWALELDGFDFVIIYRPGVKNGKPDALSRRSESRPEKGGKAISRLNEYLKKVNGSQKTIAATWTLAVM